MKFAIQINSAPCAGEGSVSAYQFIRAALSLGHEIVRVFFYYEGAYNGSRWSSPPDDETQTLGRWTELARDHGIDLVICVSAAQRRGLLGPSEVGGLGGQDEAVADGFRIAGLGLWVEACLKADRFLAFGG